MFVTARAEDADAADTAGRPLLLAEPFEPPGRAAPGPPGAGDWPLCAVMGRSGPLPLARHGRSLGHGQRPGQAYEPRHKCDKSDT